MYFDSSTLLGIAGYLAACSSIVGAIIAVYKVIERDRRQSLEIKTLKEEQTLICYGILSCLKGLQEQGCNGPVTEALQKIEKHLNQAAHT